MARPKRKSPIFDAGDARASALTTINATMDFGNGASLAALTAALTAGRKTLDLYNRKLSEADDLLNQLEAAEDGVADLSSRLLGGVKIMYGADSSEYEKAGGTRASEIKRSPRGSKTAAQPGK